MAAYFSKRCALDYQQQALTQLLDIKPAQVSKPEQLAEILYYWLCGEDDQVGHFMRTFETFSLDSADASEPEAEVCQLNGMNTIYYGNHGKRAAARAFYQYVLALKQPKTILALADESDEWITEDFAFDKALQTWGQNLVKRGFCFCQITPPAASMDEAFDSLLRWLPLYMSGQAEAYFYPRLRDQVHRHCIFVLPGEIALISHSIAGQHSSHATILTTDQRLIRAYEAEFNDYLALCRPMLTAYTTSEKLMQCFFKFLAGEGSRIQQIPTLSAETAPPEVLKYCIQQIHNADLKKLGTLYFQETQPAAAPLSQAENTLIDLAHLASAAEVRSGKVPIIFSSGADLEPIYYTPEMYRQHLQNILYLLETCPSYHFIALPDENLPEGILMVKESQQALLVRVSAPFTVFEIEQPNIVTLCQEHLLRLADKIGYRGLYRSKTIAQLKNLIAELQS